MTSRGRFLPSVRPSAPTDDVANPSFSGSDESPGSARAERAPGYKASIAKSVQRAGTSEQYTGVSTLEVLTSAVKYQRFLTGLLTPAAGAPEGDRLVADFGAGLGTFARDARALGWQVTCVELDPALRARLHAEGFDVAESLNDVKPESLDFLFSYNVLEHIEDDEEVVHSFRRVLKPGAPLLLYVPAFMVAYGPLDRAVGHVRRYRRKPLIDLVESAGFTVEVCHYSDSIGFVAALAHRVVGDGSGEIGERAVKLYDRFVFPVSRRLDVLARRFFGKNLVLIAHRRGA
jgi:SAM-dependent methyltransferase